MVQRFFGVTAQNIQGEKGFGDVSSVALLVSNEQMT